MRNKFFLFLAAFCCAFHFSAQAAIVDGTCGPNLTWSLNTADSTLTISSTGNMTNYSSNTAPWNTYSVIVKYVVIEDGVTSIGDYAFYQCTALHSATLGDSVTNIGYDAFYGCSSLSSMVIPNSVTSIGGNAFYECTSLTLVTIPNSVTSIGDCAFLGCSSLTSVTIPNSVTSIGKSAFYECNNLASIVISRNITRIENYTFFNCSSLSFVEIPYNVTIIGSSAFSKCTGLTSVTISNSVTSIQSTAFYRCSSLTSVTIPNSVTSIGSSAFSGCSKLKLITNYKEVPISINSYVFNNVDKNTCTLCVPEESVILYQNATGWNEFYHIRPIGSALAVQFVDWNGTVLSTDYVNSGEAATAPANPSREGYTFTGWDTDFSSVTEDLTVTALYEINRYRVRFYDWDGTLLKTDSVDWQSAAVAPANPTRAGYTFIGWDKSFEVITSDLDVTALYEKEQLNVTVSYVDGVENNLLDIEGIVLTLPDVPEFAGFTFLRWETVAADIENGITIQAVYEANEPTYAPTVYTNPANPAQKLICNGNVYILTDDHTYNAQGTLVK